MFGDKGFTVKRVDESLDCQVKSNLSLKMVLVHHELLMWHELISDG